MGHVLASVLQLLIRLWQITLLSSQALLEALEARNDEYLGEGPNSLRARYEGELAKAELELAAAKAAIEKAGTGTGKKGEELLEQLNKKAQVI